MRDRPQRGLEGVRAGDTVIYESRLQAEYRFEVADVDSEWITFETGQKVHADRFRREAFEVSRSRVGETAGLADERDSGQGAAGAADRSTSGAD